LPPFDKSLEIEKRFFIVCVLRDPVEKNELVLRRGRARASACEAYAAGNAGTGGVTAPTELDLVLVAWEAGPDEDASAS